MKQQYFYNNYKQSLLCKFRIVFRLGKKIPNSRWSRWQCAWQGSRGSVVSPSHLRPDFDLLSPDGRKGQQEPLMTIYYVDVSVRRNKKHREENTSVGVWTAAARDRREAACMLVLDGPRVTCYLSSRGLAWQVSIRSSNITCYSWCFIGTIWLG